MKLSCKESKRLTLAVFLVLRAVIWYVVRFGNVVKPYLTVP